MNLTAIQKVELDVFRKKWDCRETMTLRAKKRLLEQAGHIPNAFAYRAWDGIPLRVKTDLLYTYNRNQREGVKNGSI